MPDPSSSSSSSLLVSPVTGNTGHPMQPWSSASLGLIQGRLRLTVLLGPFLLRFRKSIIQELHTCLRHFLEKKPRKDKPSRDRRERRNAIRLTNEHTVETLVVADANMVQYHGAEAAQRFILTVMNMVSPERVLPLLGSDYSVNGALEAGAAPLS